MDKPGSSSDGIRAPVAAAGSCLKSRIISLYTLLIGFNLAAWAWALIAFHRHPVLLGTAFLAYTFGLRHAVDADHIAAIDNVTRKMMQQGKRPVAVGFFFSLGHSTVVFGLSVVIALASVAIQNRFDSFKSVGGVIGTSVSAFSCWPSRPSTSSSFSQSIARSSTSRAAASLLTKISI